MNDSSLALAVVLSVSVCAPRSAEAGLFGGSGLKDKVVVAVGVSSITFSNRPKQDVQISTYGRIDKRQPVIGSDFKKDTQDTNGAGIAEVKFDSFRNYMLQYICAKLNDVHYCADVAGAALGKPIEDAKLFFLRKNDFKNMAAHRLNADHSSILWKCAISLAVKDQSDTPQGRSHTSNWAFDCAPKQ